MRLENKISLITGAARGIGLSTAVRFAQEGAIVILTDIDCKAGEEAQTAVQAISPQSAFVCLDATERESVRCRANEIQERYGRIDILINNAGTTADAQFLKMSEEEWDRVIDTNLKGVFNCTQRESVVHQTPIGRMGRPEEVANAYLFLASDESSFINGAVLQVDGGLVL